MAGPCIGGEEIGRVGIFCALKVIESNFGFAAGLAIDEAGGEIGAGEERLRAGGEKSGVFGDGSGSSFEWSAVG